MENEVKVGIPKLSVHEVIVVGKLKPNYQNEKSIKAMFPVLRDENTNELLPEVKVEIMKKFSFLRKSALAENAAAMGLKPDDFFHIKVIGVENEVMKSGTGQRKISNALNSPGYSVCYRNSYLTTFNEIKEELLTKRFELVGEDPDSGEIKLHQYGLVGCWDIFPMGFKFHIHTRDSNGVLQPLMSTIRQPNGTYVKQKAIGNTGQHFVYQVEYNNIEGLRQKIREANEKHIIKVVTNDDMNRNDEGNTKPPVSEKKEEKTEKPSDEDDL